MFITSQNNHIEVSGFPVNTSTQNQTNLTLLNEALSTENINHVAVILMSETTAGNDMNTLLNIIANNSNNIHSIRFSFINDPTLSTMLFYLSGKLHCYTLTISACEGSSWSEHARTFIQSTPSLRTINLNCSSPHMGYDLTRAITQAPFLKHIQFTQLYKYTPRGFYHTLTTLISMTRIETLRTSGRNFSPLGVRTFQDALKHNSSLQLISCSPPPLKYSQEEWHPIHEEFKHTVLSNTSMESITSSNHTLHMVDFSSRHNHLQEILAINSSPISKKMKIKKKLFLNPNTLIDWIRNLTQTTNKPVIQLRNKFTLASFMFWLLNDSTECQIQAVEVVYLIVKKILT